MESVIKAFQYLDNTLTYNAGFDIKCGSVSLKRMDELRKAISALKAQPAEKVDVEELKKEIKKHIEGSGYVQYAQLQYYSWALKTIDYLNQRGLINGQSEAVSLGELSVIEEFTGQDICSIERFYGALHACGFRIIKHANSIKGE